MVLLTVVLGMAPSPQDSGLGLRHTDRMGKGTPAWQEKETVLWAGNCQGLGVRPHDSVSALGHGRDRQSDKMQGP